MQELKFKNLITQNVLFDSHCHLNEQSFDVDRAEVVERARKAGVEAIIDMGIDIDSSKRVIANSEKFDSVFAAVGIDPEYLVPGSDIFDEKVFSLEDKEFEKWLNQTYDELKILASYKKVLMIGETGIDNYWLVKRGEQKEISPEEQEKSLYRQAELLKLHCKLAKELNKPLSIHSRNAINLCLEILEEMQIKKGQSVFHSLTLDIGDDESSFQTKVKKILTQGYQIGINGIITFNNATIIRDVYAKTIGKPVNEAELSEVYKSGFIFETDAPFLAPEPKRGERNEPSFLRNIYTKNIS